MTNCAVILGSGRSGTSLTTRLLHACGMELSSELSPPNAQNPEGSFDDAEICNVQTNLLRQFGPLSLRPPSDWLESTAAKKGMAKLDSILTSRLEESQGLWGFKDLNTAYTIRLWHRLFKKHRVKPVYFVCVREPGATITSMARHYGIDEDTAELIWLSKYLEIIIETKGNFFLVHYESVLSEGSKRLVKGLAQYAGLDSGLDPSAIVEENVNPDLNRTFPGEHECKNQLVVKLYSLLKKYNGSSFERETLLRRALEFRNLQQEFCGWEQEARHQATLMHRIQSYKHEQDGPHDKPENDCDSHNLSADGTNPARNQIDYVNESHAWNKSLISDLVRKESSANLQVRELNDELEKYRIQISRYDIELAELTSQVKDLRSKSKYLRFRVKESRSKSERLSKKLKKARNEIVSLKIDRMDILTSLTFQAGQLLVAAYEKPGKNTFLLPISLLRLAYGYSVVQKMERKQKKKIDRTKKIK